jgi:hypothetical protein
VDRLLFLSHAGEDKPFVKAFEDRARRFVLSTWSDDRLRAGDFLWTSVADGLDQTHLALFFLTEASLAAARDPRRGLYLELGLLRKWQASAERAPETRVVIVDCLGLSDEEIRSVAALRPWARSLRLNGQASFAACIGGHPDADAKLDDLFRTFIRRALNSEIVVFPRPSVTRRRRFYEPSWAGYGGNAHLQTELGSSHWDAEERPHVPLELTPGGDEIRLDVHFGGTEQDWWSAILGFCTGDDERWLAIDVRGMERLVLEARAEGAPPSGVPLSVRLEDCSTTSNSGSGHQSSSAAEPPPILREYFSVNPVDLRALKWGVAAHPGNTQHVSTGEILQIALGPTAVRHPYDAVVRIKRILFQLDQI